MNILKWPWIGIKYVIRTITLVLWLLFISFIGNCIYSYYYSDMAYYEHYHKVFQKVVLQVSQYEKPFLFFIPTDLEVAKGGLDRDGKGVVILSLGTLRSFRNDDEAAAVIGHEIAHAVLFKNGLKGNTKMSENLADELGAFYTLRAGYDICKASKRWKRIGNEEGDSIEFETHPSHTYRAEHLKMPWCWE